MEITTLVYALIDPRNSAVRYIGITDSTPVPKCAANSRLKQHLGCFDGNSEKIRQEADKRETYWITYYFNLNEPLTNNVKLRSLKFKTRYG